MKKIICAIILTACASSFGQYSTAGASAAQLNAITSAYQAADATKVGTNAIQQVLTSSPTNIPSSAAVSSALNARTVALGKSLVDSGSSWVNLTTAVSPLIATYLPRPCGLRFNGNNHWSNWQITPGITNISMLFIMGQAPDSAADQGFCLTSTIQYQQAGESRGYFAVTTNAILYSTYTTNIFRISIPVPDAARTSDYSSLDFIVNSNKAGIGLLATNSIFMLGATGQY